MEKIIAELAEILASAERVKANAERRYLETPGSFENDRNEYMCGYVDAMRHALQSVKEYHQQQYIIREARKSAGWREEVEELLKRFCADNGGRAQKW